MVMNRSARRRGGSGRWSSRCRLYR